MVIVRLMGGLGNQLFQYALGWRLCLDGKRKFRMDRRYLLHPTYFRVHRDYCLDIFGIEPSDASADEYAQFRGKLYTERDGCCFTPDILLETSPLYLDGYWQSERYFADAGDRLRGVLKFAQPLTPEGENIADAIRASHSICLNVRRTDYLTDPVLNVCGIDYFSRGVSYVKERVSNARLFVFSDDVAWCQANFSFGIPTVFVDHRYAGDRFGNYLQLMTLCRHFVIPNSTFGWWAAWLAAHPEKIVVTPATWLSNPALNYSQIVPRDWVKLENQPVLAGVR